MHNRKVRFTTSLLAAAACVVLAVVIFGSNKTFALDAVGAAINKAESMTCRMTVTVDAMLLDLQFTGKTQMSAKYGSRTDMYAGDKLIASTISTPDGRVVSGVGGSGPSVQVNFEDRDMLSPEKFRPDAFIDSIKTLSGDPDVDLGVRMIDGVEAHGFEIEGSKLGTSPAPPNDRATSPNDRAVPKGEAMQGALTRIWVDTQTLLPVKFEVEITTPIGKGPMKVVCDQFQWNVPIDPELFDTTTLESSAEGSFVLNVPAATEEALIVGLREHADKLGDYPNSLNFVMIGMDIWRKSAMMTPEEKAVFAGDENEQEFIQRLMSLYAGTLFYQRQAEHGKTKYFGSKVKPGDADAVLVQWQLADGGTRVIYGDLHTETLPARE